MTIRRGETWGVPAPPPAGMVVLRDGIAVHEWVLDHRRKGIAVPPFGLAGGDLARTVAGGSADQFSVGATLISLDLVRVTAGEMVTWSTAHVVARRSWWTGEVVLVMTAQFLGTADVTPRGHPNDGKADVLRVDPAMRRRTRWQARRRAATASHLPHPQLSVSMTDHAAFRFARPLVVWVDGVRWTTAADLTIDVEADAYSAYI